MTDNDLKLPESVTKINIDNKDIYLIGTAHVSKESVEDVRVTIEAIKPDSVCVELCAGRFKSLTQKDAWKKMNIFKVIKDKRADFLLVQLIMSYFYKKLVEIYEAHLKK